MRARYLAILIGVHSEWLLLGQTRLAVSNASIYTVYCEFNQPEESSHLSTAEKRMNHAEETSTTTGTTRPLIRIDNFSGYLYYNRYITYY